MNNSITNWVINFVETQYPNDYEFDKREICNAIWLDQGFEDAYHFVPDEPTDFFIAAMDSVDWEAVEESFFPASVDVWWDVTIEHRGRTEIQFDDREEYELYKSDPAMYLASYINHDYASESYEEDVSDISTREA